MHNYGVLNRTESQRPYALDLVYPRDLGVSVGTASSPQLFLVLRNIHEWTIIYEHQGLIDLYISPETPDCAILCYLSPSSIANNTSHPPLFASFP